MKALCQWDVQGEKVTDSLQYLTTIDESGFDEEKSVPPAEVLAYARELIEGYWARSQSVDDRIGAASVNWGVSRSKEARTQG